MNTDISQLHIAVLKGGPGSERAVSLASAKGVSEALASLGAKVTDVDVTGPDFTLPEGCDLAFNVIHGTFGEDGQLQLILDAIEQSTRKSQKGSAHRSQPRPSTAALLWTTFPTPAKHNPNFERRFRRSAAFADHDQQVPCTRGSFPAYRPAPPFKRLTCGNAIKTLS